MLRQDRFFRFWWPLVFPDSGKEKVLRRHLKPFLSSAFVGSDRSDKHLSTFVEENKLPFWAAGGLAIPRAKSIKPRVVANSQAAACVSFGWSHRNALRAGGDWWQLSETPSASFLRFPWQYISPSIFTLFLKLHSSFKPSKETPCKIDVHYPFRRKKGSFKKRNTEIDLVTPLM